MVVLESAALAGTGKIQKQGLTCEWARARAHQPRDRLGTEGFLKLFDALAVVEAAADKGSLPRNKENKHNERYARK